MKRQTWHPFPRKEGTRAIVLWVIRLTRTDEAKGNRACRRSGGRTASGTLAPRDPRGMVKARLLEVQSRSGSKTPRHNAGYRGGTRREGPGPRLSTSLGEGRRGPRVRHRTTSPSVGMSGRPAPRYHVPGSRSTRLTLGGRPSGQRSLHSSQRSGKPATGRRETGHFDVQDRGGTRDARRRDGPGHHPRSTDRRRKWLESRMTSKESRPVWRGAEGKGVARLPRRRPTRPLHC